VFLNLLLFQGATASPWAQLLLPLLLFAVFYILIFFPMQRQRRNTAKMLAALENGQTVLTSGGIVGTISAIQEDETVVLRVKPDNIRIQVARSAISSVVSAGDVKK
jgi:preprotein translocase subunit YajC